MIVVVVVVDVRVVVVVVNVGVVHFDGRKMTVGHVDGTMSLSSLVVVDVLVVVLVEPLLPLQTLYLMQPEFLHFLHSLFPPVVSCLLVMMMLIHLRASGWNFSAKKKHCPTHFPTHCPMHCPMHHW